MINPALNKAHKPTKQLWETFGAFDSKDRNALKSGLVRQSSVRQLRSSPASGWGGWASSAFMVHSPASALLAGQPWFIHPTPRAALLLSLPAFSRALFHINSSAGCKVSKAGEKLFKRDPADRHLFAAEGSWKGGGRLLLLPAINSSVQQMWTVFTPWHMNKKCRSKRDSELQSRPWLYIFINCSSCLESAGERCRKCRVPGIYLDLLRSACAEIYLFLQIQYCVTSPQRKKDSKCFIIPQGRSMLCSHPCFHLAQFPLLPGNVSIFCPLGHGAHAREATAWNLGMKRSGSSYPHTDALRDWGISGSLTKILSSFWVVTPKRRS